MVVNHHLPRPGADNQLFCLSHPGGRIEVNHYYQVRIIYKLRSFSNVMMEINHLFYILHPEKELLESVGRDHPCILAPGYYPPSHCQHGAYCVTVGIDMTDEQNMI